MTTSHADLLPVDDEHVLFGGQGPSAISSEVDPRERLFDRRSQATSGGTEHSPQLAVVPVATAVRRSPDEPADEETRMRLLAALLVLGALLLWITFLQD